MYVCVCVDTARSIRGCVIYFFPENRLMIDGNGTIYYLSPVLLCIRAIFKQISYNVDYHIKICDP